MIRDLFDKAWKGIQRAEIDSFEFEEKIAEKPEDLFLRHQGKIVRHITLVQLDFDHQILDTSTKIGGFITRAATRLHATTKPWVLLNHVFIKEKLPLNAYEVADNERFLRSQPFIQDVRILPAPIQSTNDSIDLVIVCKDVFSLGGDLYNADVSGFTLRGYDANFLGMAQRLQVSVLYGRERNPGWGFEAAISRSSLGGSFINGQVGFTNINTGRSQGNEEEQSVFLRLDRPLKSPDALLAGGLELSHNESRNYFQKPDSLFYNYRYNLVDVWGGLNFTAGKEQYAATDAGRLRKFIALRYFDNTYTQPPIQIGQRFDPIYNDRRGLLASLTIFKLQYYRTRYFYGFGLTEDLPRGFRIIGTGGWYNQNGSDRPYTGIDIMRYSATQKGDYFQTIFRAGGFYRNNRLEDLAMMVATTAYSRLIHFRKDHLRQRITASFTTLYNRIATEPLYINNELGLPNFGAGEIKAATRTSIWSESILFINRKVFGFRLAPFVFGGITIVLPEQKNWHLLDGYSCIGGGIRFRNENLIFGTVELRTAFFPRTDGQTPAFNLELNTNLRYRYNAAYIRAPDVFNFNDNN